MDLTRSSGEERTREFVRLLGLYDRRLHAYILSLVPHFADAEEITQQVRLLLWEQFEQYDASKDFGAWARTVAYYRVLAFRKQSSRRHAHLSPEFLAAVADESHHSTLDSNQQYQAMLECLRTLSQAKRNLLMQYYSTKGSMRQLAETLGLKFDAVRHNILRSRNALADCIDRRLQKEELQ